jgi:hypothetical protein
LLALLPTLTGITKVIREGVVVSSCKLTIFTGETLESFFIYRFYRPFSFTGENLENFLLTAHNAHFGQNAALIPRKYLDKFDPNPESYCHCRGLSASQQLP